MKRFSVAQSALKGFEITGPAAYKMAREWLWKKKVLVEVSGPMRMLKAGLCTKTEWRMWITGGNVNLHQTFTKFGGGHPNSRLYYFFFPVADWEKFMEFVLRVDNKIKRMKDNGKFENSGGNVDSDGDNCPYLGVLLQAAGQEGGPQEGSVSVPEDSGEA